MTVRELPPDEWDRLLDYPFGANGLPPADACRVMVAEDSEGKIIGIWSVMLASFMEGMWVDPAHRKGLTTGRLVVETMNLLREAGVPQVLTIVQEEHVKALAEQAGFQSIDGDLMVLNLFEAAL